MNTATTEYATIVAELMTPEAEALVKQFCKTHVNPFYKNGTQTTISVATEYFTSWHTIQFPEGRELLVKKLAIGKTLLIAREAQEEIERQVKKSIEEDRLHEEAPLLNKPVSFPVDFVATKSLTGVVVGFNAGDDDYESEYLIKDDKGIIWYRSTSKVNAL